MEQEKIRVIENSNLDKLRKYLNYEISGTILFGASFFAPVLLFLASGAALIFTPFMIYVLCREGRKGWLAAFFLMVILPAAVFVSIPSGGYTVTLLLAIPFALFYFYCFLLRFEVNNWISEINYRNERIKEKIENEEQMKEFLRRLK